ncbi:recombinase family protein [Micromonospora sp. NPDC004540]|uniref:recombinase family protein n=1 Tax=Micromonospora sp. NPDC004540 TaxID=3154457 RepID=UPI0033A26189
MPETQQAASLYLRISVVTEASDSLARQERDLRSLAQAEGLDVVAVHRDEGVSGAAKDRPAFRAWLADAEAGRAGVLLSWSMDRVSRGGLPAVAKLIETLGATGARLLTYRDRVDSASPSFKLTASIMSAVAEAERDAIAARILNRQASDRQQGRWTRPRPYGYVVQGGRLVQHAEEADVIREAVRQVLAGRSLRAIVAGLDDAGVPSPAVGKGYTPRDGQTSPRWRVPSLRRILTSPALAGLYPRRDGAVGRGLDGEAVTVSDEPIITLAERAQVLAAIEQRAPVTPSGSRRTVVGAAPKHALSGLLRCECGGPLVFDNERVQANGERRHAYFRCQRQAHNGRACQGRPVVRASVAEAWVEHAVLSRLAALDPGSDAFEAVASRWLTRQDPTDDAERRAAREAVTVAEADVADLEAARYERGEFPGPDGAERWQRLYRRSVGRLNAARDVLAAFPDVLDVGGLLDPVIFAEALATNDTAERRALYRLALDRVTVRRAEGGGYAFTPTWAGEE